MLDAETRKEPRIAQDLTPQLIVSSRFPVTEVLDRLDESLVYFEALLHSAVFRIEESPKTRYERLVFFVRNVQGQLAEFFLQLSGQVANRRLWVFEVRVGVGRRVNRFSEDDERITSEDGALGVIEPGRQNLHIQLKVVSLLNFESDACASGLERQYRLTGVAHALRKKTNGSAAFQKLETSLEGQLVFSHFPGTILTAING
jgi:hypothetical protein